MASKIGFNLFKLFSNSVNNFRCVSQRGIAGHVRKTAIEIKKRQKEYMASLTEEERIELTRRSNFIEWNYSAEVFAFGKRLHEEFPPELLVQAFTHRSYVVKQELKMKELDVAEAKINLDDNESLVPIGEKIISDYTARYVSHFLPRFPLEGIESITNHLSSEEVLAYVSKNLGTTFLILSDDYPVKEETYSKTLKAIVGALKQCQGINRSQLFVRDFIVTQLVGKDVNDFLNINNPLEVVSEILKRDGKEAPEPRIIGQSGMNTIMANYHVGIYTSKQLIGHCFGETLDIAVEMAAFDALKRFFHTTESHGPISYDVEKVPENVSNLRLSEWCSKAFSQQTKQKIRAS